MSNKLFRRSFAALVVSAGLAGSVIVLTTPRKAAAICAGATADVSAPIIVTSTSLSAPPLGCIPGTTFCTRDSVTTPPTPVPQVRVDVTVCVTV
jgi:hypothetical protein